MYRYYMTSYLVLFRCTDDTVEALHPNGWHPMTIVNEYALLKEGSTSLSESEAFLEMV